MLVAVDGFARVRRRHAARRAVAGWWIASRPRAARRRAAFAWLLGVIGLLPATPPEPAPPGAIPVAAAGARRSSPSSSCVAAGAGSSLRPALLRAPAACGPLRGAGAGAALLLVWCVLAALLWLRNPYAAALLVPGRAPAARRRGARACACGAPVAVGARRARRAAPFAARRPVDRRPARLRRRSTSRGLRAAASPAASSARWAGCSGASVAVCLVAALAPGAARRAPARGAAGGPPQITVRGPVTLRGPRLARRHGVGAAAMRRALGTVLVVAGLLALADAALTLAWQEPLSALRAARAQRRPRGASCARSSPPAPAPRAPTAPTRRRRRPRARAARGATARRWPSCASRASACARRGARHRARRSARGPGLIDGDAAPRRSAARPRSPATARPTARRSATSTRCAAATRSSSRLPYAHVPLRASGHGGSSIPRTCRVLRRAGHDRLVLSRLPPALFRRSAHRGVGPPHRSRTVGQRTQASASHAVEPGSAQFGAGAPTNHDRRWPIQ